MEYPYIAILWSPRDELQSLAASRLLHSESLQNGSEWQQCVGREGLTILTRAQRPGAPQASCLKAYSLPGDRGLILGTLFRRGGTAVVPPHEMAGKVDLAEACLTTRGNYLTKHLWGTYVAFLSDSRTGDWSIARDCSGMLPCYYTSLGGVILAFSDIRDIVQLAECNGKAPLVTLGVNWRYIIGFLAASQMQIRETGVSNIYELLAGESLVFTGGRHFVHSLWDPVSIAQGESWVDLQETCCVLRETTFSCIEAWASAHHRILHSLSGGFDSSLVLSLLTRSAKRPKVMCLNRFATGPAEDERHYARIAARAAGVKLEELPHLGGWSLEDSCMKICRTAKPTIAQLFAGMDAETNDLLGASKGAEVLWTGQGGDHLFMAIETVMGVADCWIHHGLGQELKAAFRDASKLTGKSYLHIARTICKLVRADNFLLAAELSPRTAFLAPDALPEDLATYILNPWLLSSASLPPGKRLQVTYLAEVLNRHRPYYGIQQLQEFHPLLSQPLIELCLQIPVYRLLAGGKTRGLARQAFQTDLPAAILGRERKGQTTHRILGVLRQSMPFLTEALLHGQLADQGLLSREALASILQPDAAISSSSIFPLLACLAAERWLASWSNSMSLKHVSGRRDSPLAACPPAVGR